MKTKSVLLAIAFSLVTACGGSQGTPAGGSGGVTPTPTSTPQPSPSATPVPTPAPSKAKFAYVLNRNEDSISQYQIGEDGNLIPFSNPTVQTGGYPFAMVMDPTQSFLYVSNLNDDSINQYSVGANGALNSIGTTIYSVGNLMALTASPDGKSIYGVSYLSNQINRYAIGLDGTLSLSQIRDAPDAPVNLVFSPTGAYAYTSLFTELNISQYSVAGDGSLSALQPGKVATSGCNSGPIASVTASGGDSFVYALSCVNSSIDVFKITSQGALSLIETVSTELFPEGMLVSSKNLYVTSAGNQNIQMFSVGADGKLSLLAQPVVAAGEYPANLAVDSVGKMAYVLDYSSDQILHYTVGSDGGLIPTGHAVSTGVSPSQIILK